MRAWHGASLCRAAHASAAAQQTRMAHAAVLRLAGGRARGYLGA
jgi:hypothetical protein